MNALIENLKSKGLKVTPQRLAVYRMLSETNTHPNAETIHRMLKETHPSLSLATVYKTLHTLHQAGLTQILSMRDESFRHDADIRPHAHMICSECCNVYDLFAAHQMDKLHDELQEMTDFSIVSEQIYLYGICAACRK